MKRERIVIRGTRKNPIEVYGQAFSDAIIYATNTTFKRCKFTNCSRHFKGTSGLISCEDDNIGFISQDIRGVTIS